MYRTCIFCSRDLGANESIEHFPVGSRIAFDANKGRLWAVCPRCMRWNLAPIEERWEAVEEAEQKFRDARMRVQSENIGMAKLADGTSLIRIGSALQGELAAWRYGAQLVKRRTNLYLTIGASVVAGGAIVAGLPLIAGIGIPAAGINPLVQAASFIARTRAERRIILRLDEDESPTGAAMTLRRMHLRRARIESADGAMAISMLEPVSEIGPWYRFRSMKQNEAAPRVEITGRQAQLVAARAMVDYNQKGGTKKTVNHALERLAQAGSAEQFIQQVSRSGYEILPPARNMNRNVNIPGPRRIMGSFRGERIPVIPRRGLDANAGARLSPTDALALEMALHDESERRAMEGELSVLEEAWREAEMIARIADALPEEPPSD
jgi:hypothetical protein